MDIRHCRPCTGTRRIDMARKLACTRQCHWGDHRCNGTANAGGSHSQAHRNSTWPETTLSGPAQAGHGTVAPTAGRVAASGGSSREHVVPRSERQRPAQRERQFRHVFAVRAVRNRPGRQQPEKDRVNFCMLAPRASTQPARKISVAATYSTAGACGLGRSATAHSPTP